MLNGLIALTVQYEADVEVEEIIKTMVKQNSHIVFILLYNYVYYIYFTTIYT